MAGASVTIQVDDQDARALLDRLAKDGTSDLAPRLGEYLLQSTKERFSTQKAPDGTPWQALQPRYAKRKKYHKDKVLTLRGYLRSNIRYQPAGDSGAIVGTNTPYAAIHHFGGMIKVAARRATLRLRTVAGKILFAGKKQKATSEREVTIGAHEIKMPARPIFGVSAEDRSQFADIVRHWIRERVQK